MHQVWGTFVLSLALRWAKDKLGDLSVVVKCLGLQCDAPYRGHSTNFFTS